MDAKYFFGNRLTNPLKYISKFVRWHSTSTHPKNYLKMQKVVLIHININ